MTTLEASLRQGSTHLIFEQSNELGFDTSDPKRIILKGVKNHDSINVDLASRMLAAVLYVSDGYNLKIRLVKKVLYNRKSEQSGELILDSETERVLGGYGWVDWKQYHLVPTAHQQGTLPNWKLEDNLLIVANNFTPEYAEQAIAEAQVKYDFRRVA